MSRTFPFRRNPLCFPSVYLSSVWLERTIPFPFFFNSQPVVTAEQHKDGLLSLLPVPGSARRNVSRWSRASSIHVLHTCRGRRCCGTLYKWLSSWRQLRIIHLSIYSDWGRPFWGKKIKINSSNNQSHLHCFKNRNIYRLKKPCSYSEHFNTPFPWLLWN